jgi:hypothetical protein
VKYPRFRVATCEGYLSIIGGGHRRGQEREPGLSATVCDTYHGWKEVRTYRSEDRVVRNGETRSRGVVGARQDAEDHATYLNTVHRRESHGAVVTAQRRETRINGLVG